MNNFHYKTLWGTCDALSLQPAIKKRKSSLPNKLIFMPDNSIIIEKKFGRNKKALTFALPKKTSLKVM